MSDIRKTKGKKMSQVIQGGRVGSASYKYLPHPFEATDVPAGVAELAAKSTDAILRAIGPEFGTISPARVRHPGISLNVHIRSERLPLLEGGSFHFIAGSTNCGTVASSYVESAVEAAGRLLAAKRDAIAMIDQTRRLVKDLWEGHNGANPPARLPGIGVGLRDGNQQLYAVAELETLGEDLIYAPLTLIDHGPSSFSDKIVHELAVHARRASLLPAGGDHGSGRAISDLASNIIAAAGVELSEVLSKLRDLGEMSFEFDNGRYRSGLRWNSGVLHGDFQEISNGEQLLRIFGDTLSLNLDLPATIRTALPGRKIGALIKHPLIPSEAVIEAIAEADDGRGPNPRGQLFDISLRMGTSAI